MRPAGPHKDKRRKKEKDIYMEDIYMDDHNNDESLYKQDQDDASERYD